MPWITSPVRSIAFVPTVAGALNVLAKADPDLSREVRALAIRIVGASPYKGADARPFGSASSMMLWGLLVINAERYDSVFKMIQGLIHESAHLLLFAHSIHEPLVTNPIEDRFVSPLRKDPRPMDGVFHATFVTARLHYANRVLRDRLDRFSAPPFTREELDSNLAEYRELYFGGLDTVERHGKLTGRGRRILQETADYMKAC